MKRPLLVLVVLSACFESHEAGRQQLTDADCIACHQQTLGEPAAQKGHGTFAADGMPPPTCGDCHDTSSWTPALGGLHPKPFTYTYTDSSTGQVKNDTFLLASSPHDGIKCRSCHDLSLLATTEPAARGYNADCTQCHPKDARIDSAHVNAVRSFPGVVITYTGYKAEDPTFCRACHPQGLAMGHGPTNPFRLPHGRSACASCHDTGSPLGDAGGANVRCAAQCHNGTGPGDRHCNDPGHHPNCLNAGCHPDGRKHDGEERCPAPSGT